MILDEARRPGQSISAVARKFGISPSLVFNWQRQMDDGGHRALAAGEAVVPESEAKMLRARVRELERLLGKKTMEAAILKAAVETVQFPGQIKIGALHTVDFIGVRAKDRGIAVRDERPIAWPANRDPLSHQSA